MSPAEIARTIGVHRSTVSRELKRNSDGRGYHKYNHDLAQRKAEGRMKNRPHACKFTDEMKRESSSTLQDRTTSGKEVQTKTPTA